MMAAVAAAVLTACGGGGGGSASVAVPAPTPAPVAVARNLSCVAGDAHAVPYGVLVNNMWNQDSAGTGPRRQCLRVRDTAAGPEYGWSWEWPTTDGIYAFPELLVGASPWSAEPSNDNRFPRAVGATRSLQIAYDAQTVSNGKQNTAAEFWFTATNLVAGVAEGVPVKAELMIWTDTAPGIVAIDDLPIAEVVIDGMRWRVYLQRDWRDVSVSDSSRWTLISYVATTNSPTARYDARKFFQDAIDRGVIAPGDFVAGLELGNEIISGAGSTWLRNVSVSVD